MARRPRFQNPGGIWHVVNRGNDGLVIFTDEDDYLRFLQILNRAVARFRFKVYSFCLLPTHFHLLIQVGEIDISRVMHWISTSYAMYFNRRHHRRGHVFEGRFKSPACLDDGYFFTLLAYINLNAFKHGLVEDPIEWPWSSHRSLMQGKGSAILDPEYPLSLFHAEREIAVTRYARFIAERMQDCRNAPTPLDVTPHATKIPPKEDCHESAHIDDEIGLAEIAESVWQETRIDLARLRGRSKADDVAAARRLLAARAIAAGHRPSDIAAFLNRSISVIAWYLYAYEDPYVLGAAGPAPNFMGRGP